MAGSNDVESLSQCLLTHLVTDRPLPGLMLTVEHISDSTPAKYDFFNLLEQFGLKGAKPNQSPPPRRVLETDSGRKVKEAVTVKKSELHFVGYGYDAGKKEVKEVTPLTTQTGESVTVVDGQSEFNVPVNVKHCSNRNLVFGNENSLTGETCSSGGEISGGNDAGFLAKLSAGFFRKSKSSNQKVEDYKVLDVQVGTIYLENPRSHPKTSKFKKDIDALPKKFDPEDPNNVQKFTSFFSYWGTHLVKKQGLGGIAKIKISKKVQTRSTATSISGNAEVDGSIAAVGQVCGGEVSSQIFSGKNQNAAGSDTVLLVAGSNEIFDGEQEWMKNVKENPAALEKRIELFKYADFLEGDNQTALKEATTHYCNNSQKESKESSLDVASRLKKSKK